MIADHYRTTFSFPTRTLFGVGALRELPTELNKLGVRSPLVATDAGLLKTDAYRSLVEILGAPGQGETWFLYSGVHANPIEQDVRECAAAFRVNE